MRPTPDPASTVASMKSELIAAGGGLVDNPDLLRGVLAGCGDCIKILDLDGRLQFMSEGGKRVMEVEDFGALKGCPWPDFWTGAGNADATRAIETARAGGTARFQGAANTARGTPRYWDVQVSPILGSDGKPAYLLSISRDITEEWRATAELKEAVQRQAQLARPPVRLHRLAELGGRLLGTGVLGLQQLHRSFRERLHLDLLHQHRQRPGAGAGFDVEGAMAGFADHADGEGVHGVQFDLRRHG